MATRKTKPAPPRLPAGPVEGRFTFGRNGVTLAVTNGPAEEDLAAVRVLIDRCSNDAPDPADLDALRAWMDRDGAMMEAERLFDVTRYRVVRPWRNAAAEEMVIAGLRDLRNRMGYDEGDAVERLLIELICTAWLVLQSEETELQSILTRAGGYRFNEVEAVEKRVQRAYGRLLRAVESLEKVRALRAAVAARFPAAPLPAAVPAPAPDDARARIGEKLNRLAALPPHAGDGAAPPAETIELAEAGGRLLNPFLK